MKKIFKRIRKEFIAGFLCLLLAILVFFSCLKIESVDYENILTAGEIATFKVNMHITSVGDGTRLVFATLVPKSWNTVTNSSVTYTSSYEANIERTMSLIPDGVSPKNFPGISWAEALKQHYGIGPNVIEDMEWIVFWSDQMYEIRNGDDITASISIKIKIGENNMRVKLGFFINYVDDGLSFDPTLECEDIYYTDCIEVVDGDADIYVDFCERHFNMFTPLSATKNDIITIKFQGDVSANALDNTNEIYLYAKALTNSFHEYTVSERTAKTRMNNESGKTYSLTFWPAEFFSIPQNEEILRIEYYYTNYDGSLSVLQPNDEDEPETWFLTPFTCK